MVYCVVFGCYHKAGRDKVRFFSIPAVIKNQCNRTKELSIERRRLWLARICRKNLQDKDITKDKKVCDRHFISGRPSKLFDNLSPDWAPSIALGHDNHKNKAAAIDRYLRQKQRKKNKLEENQIRSEKMLTPVNAAHADLKESNTASENDETFENEVTLNHRYINLDEHESEDVYRTDVPVEDMEKMKSEIESLKKELDVIRKDNMHLRSKIQMLKSHRLNYCVVNEKTLEQDDDKVKFYTGLPSFSVLKSVFELVANDMKPSLHNSLTLFQEFIIILMKLRLNLFEQDLAYRFCVDQSTISRYLSKWLPIMSDKLRCFISCPNRETFSLVRNKYHILQSILPDETLMLRKGEFDARIDQIVTIAWALANLCCNVVIINSGEGS